jgi:hypothetical protein
MFRKHAGADRSAEITPITTDFHFSGELDLGVAAKTGQEDK